MKKIFTVGLDLPTEEIEDYSFEFKTSLSDADIVIFDPENFLYGFKTQNEKFRGKDTFTIDSSFDIYSYDKHWKKEIIDFLSVGKTVFIHLSQRQDYYIHTGRKETSGTGRNQQVTNLVDSYCNYSFLPFNPINFVEIEDAVGYPCSPIVTNIVKNFKDDLSFEVYLEKVEGHKVLFTSKNREKNFSCFFKYLNGYVVFLPCIYIDSGNFYNEKTKKFNKAGIELSKRYISNILEIESIIRNESISTPKPDWLSKKEFEIPIAEKTKELIEINKRKIETIQLENTKLEQLAESQESLKDLLFETGKKLEVAVINALGILGYKAENFNNGKLELDQIIISPSGNRFIGECEGKDTKDIDITKFRQLLDSLNEDFSRPEVNEKAYGILFGNPQRLLEPNKRKLTFTEKCLRGAEREKVGLVLTTNLFKVCNYIVQSKNESFKEKCRIAIENQLGKIIEFPEIPK